MSVKSKQPKLKIESSKDSENLSPIDEVRLIREALSAEFSQDINKLADHATAVSVAWREQLRTHGAK